MTYYHYSTVLNDLTPCNANLKCKYANTNQEIFHVDAKNVKEARNFYESYLKGEEKSLFKVIKNENRTNLNNIRHVTDAEIELLLKRYDDLNKNYHRGELVGSVLIGSSLYNTDIKTSDRDILLVLDKCTNIQKIYADGYDVIYMNNDNIISKYNRGSFNIIDIIQSKKLDFKDSPYQHLYNNLRFNSYSYIDKSSAFIINDYKRFITKYYHSNEEDKMKKKIKTSLRTGIVQQRMINDNIHYNPTFTRQAKKEFYDILNEDSFTNEILNMVKLDKDDKYFHDFIMNESIDFVSRID